MNIEIAIHHSLEELKISLSADLQMLLNYRTALVKQQSLKIVDQLKMLEENLQKTISAIEMMLEQH